MGAPSGGNTQPWHLYVLTGKPLEGLTRAAMGHLTKGGTQAKPEYEVYPAKRNMSPELHEAYMQRRVKVAQDMWALMGVDRGDKAARAGALMRNFQWWGAPVGCIITVDRCSDKNAWAHRHAHADHCLARRGTWLGNSFPGGLGKPGFLCIRRSEHPQDGGGLVRHGHRLP